MKWAKSLIITAIFMLATNFPASSHQLDSLLLMLKSGEEGSRKEAAEMLGKTRDPKAVPALIGSLRDVDDDVREESAKSLGIIGDKRAVVPLIGALNDEDRSVRSAAAGSLGNLGDPRAIKPLLQLMSSTRDPRGVLACRNALNNLDFLNKIEVKER